MRWSSQSHKELCGQPPRLHQLGERGEDKQRPSDPSALGRRPGQAKRRWLEIVIGSLQPNQECRHSMIESLIG
jgi:hypothetical protein